MELLTRLAELPAPIYLSGTTAMQYYLERRLPSVVTISIVGDLIDIAKNFTDPAYTSIEGIDAIAEMDGSTLLITCRDTRPEPSGTPGNDLDHWHYDTSKNIFIDEDCVYRRLRDGELEGSVPADSAMLHTVIALSQLPLNPGPVLQRSIASHNRTAEVPGDMQKILLSTILSGRYAHVGLNTLYKTGWINHMWPNLALLNMTEQGKSEHPEGNVWQHSLEALKYRKSIDLRVSLAILLHDIGKPHAQRTQQHRFHLHADIGARIASRHLQNIGFDAQTIADVCWLIRYHSIPGALEQLPSHRSAPLMSNPLFPLLLELYRCDLSATYRGPEGYYRACTVYRRFLKHNRNPFRDPAGKKLLNSLVE